MDWIKLAKDRTDVGPYVCGNQTSVSIECGEFHE